MDTSHCERITLTPSFEHDWDTSYYSYAYEVPTSSGQSESEFNITPSERLRKGSPLSERTKARIDMATKATQGRCFVSNVDKTYADVQYTHALQRASSDKFLTRLEYSFGILRGSLNVDTRLNVFPLASDLHHAFNEGWLLFFPEMEELKKYEAGEKPDLKYNPEQTARYKYTLAASPDMEDFTITRHSYDSTTLKLSGHETYQYPFESFPPLESHVHPAFMICHIGQTLKTIPTILAFSRAHPTLADALFLIGVIYRKWTHVKPPPKFLANVVPQNNDGTDNSGSTNTRPVRVYRNARAYFDGKTLRSLDVGAGRQQHKQQFIKEWISNVEVEVKAAPQLVA